MLSEKYENTESNTKATDMVLESAWWDIKSK